MDGENPLPAWVRQILIGIGLFLAGALLAFGYSYRPLHGALSWQVDQLESRLDQRNLENLRLSDELAAKKSVEATAIDPDTYAQVERELEQTKRVLNQAERDLKRAEKKRKTADASASKWQKRFRELERQPAPVAAPAPPAPSASTEAEAKPGSAQPPDEIEAAAMAVDETAIPTSASTKAMEPTDL
ncbi:MAG: hypothetical protein ABGX04_05980 [Myxococcales bacterium]|nr:hypothetical protein [Myxococcales bacterium]HIK84294.1 hypothetical protein [Myxococcales bacterium]